MTGAVVALALLAAAPRAFAAGAETQNASPGILTVSGFYLFYNETAPLSFVPSVASELPKDRVELGEVSGSSCQRGVSIPTSLSLNATDISAAAGDGGYFKALENIRLAHPKVIGIYDVRADQRRLTILHGIYNRLCIEIVARAFALKP